MYVKSLFLSPNFTLRIFHHRQNKMSLVLPRALQRTAKRSNLVYQAPLSSPRISRYSTGKASPKPSKNPSYPGFNFKELGASRTVKVVVIVALSIGGMMESIFWAQVLWAKFGPEKIPKTLRDGESEKESEREDSQ